ncbi:Envelope fusion protein [Aphis craccivora]|uniref:Envelope fusion protein n=1 Tax=Aphis craccivora TaxID=307492 RepID=A0A6G0WMK3_APHCR|nr:Envelope fusion protein [Aphis craccivora]
MWKLRTTIFHKLKHKNEWLYVTNNDSVFVTCEEDKESKNYILEGASIIAVNETCRGYANRDILIPGRIAGTTQYSDFIPTSVLKEPNVDSGNNNFIKTIKIHHVKTNQMSDLNDITFKQEQVAEQI